MATREAGFRELDSLPDPIKVSGLLHCLLLNQPLILEHTVIEL